MNPAAFLPLLLFVISYSVVIFYKGWSVGLYTLIVAVSALIFVELVGSSTKARKALAYVIFFITPFLTVIGQIGALTGFGRSDISLPWQGIAFATSGIAFQIYQGKLNFKNLFGSVLQPLRLISGPLALSFEPVHKLNLQRIRIYLGWIILGSFFYGVLASGIASLLILRYSTESLDVLCFAIVFELYVYLNFCGISLMILGFLNLFGIRTALNFNAPFSAKNIIGYWHRWHMSFSAVLKALFFQPTKKIVGTSAAVIIVFTASAMWHGITLNFFIWGLFHAIGWLIAYHLPRFPCLPFQKLLNVFLMVFFILVGRLIFSEDHAPTLFIKLQNLFNFNWNVDAIVLNTSLDIQMLLTLGTCLAIICLEIFLPKKMFHYKMLRQGWVLFLLFGLTLLYGSNGLGSAYGTR